MEFFPGAFEREWERRRAMLMHEMRLGQVEKVDWDEPRRGGAARLAEEGFRKFARSPRRNGGSHLRWTHGEAGSSGRSMRARFAALARGSQPAVVKLASYGGGARAAAMMSYTSRGGELAVENERGERVLGRDAVAKQWAEWDHLFDNRAASRDLAVFHVSINSASLSSDVDQDDQLREILRSGFGDRQFVYTARKRDPDELYVSGVVVLRDGSGERLTGDRKAAEIVQQRYDDTDAGRDIEARFRFHGYGNGVEWGTARIRQLVARTNGEVRDNTGRLIGDAALAGDLVQKEWRKALHSRKGRDVMHLIISARAGTDASAFEGAVREFLGEQFAGHRYVFAVHDPARDPKEMEEGGKRPHIHAHAIVTVRSETGGRIVTSPQLFREWRSVMAEKAREQGIHMELNDRREFAGAPAYTRNQVRPVSYRGRTEHEGTSHAAQARYRAKRSNRINLAASDRSRQYAAKAAEIWNEIANEERGTREGAFAMQQRARFDGLAENNQAGRAFAARDRETVKNAIGMMELVDFVKGEDGKMREMTRQEFEAYENRVEAVLASLGRTLHATDRAEFDKIAATVREVVDIRREFLELLERQAGFSSIETIRRDHTEEIRTGDERRQLQDADFSHMAEGDVGAEGSTKGDRDRRHIGGEGHTAQQDLFDSAVARHGESAVREGGEILAEYDAAFQSLDRAATRYSSDYFRADISDDERTAVRADYAAASNRYDAVLQSYAREALDGNTYLYEQSKGEENLLMALKEEATHRAARRRIDMYDPSRNSAVRNNDEQAVCAGDELFARIDSARMEAHSLYEPETRDSRSASSSGRAETEAEQDARVARQTEAESRHRDLLREAARAALDGNNYIREMATIRHDLNNEIHLESRRRVEAEQSRDENVDGVSGRFELGDRGARSNEEYKADAPQQHVPRLRRIELEIERRQDRGRDDRGR
ncbi:hypothetical protein [Mesorhizobium sp.]|uniref:relaxase/mobilization nuclease domain-containing protein n=1 Tax=Mesorhizobium sp. TaxID=1871066 RepID=UPI0025BD4E73|nr:hypothetical protein [Mesorhizobium sp.]